MPPLKIMKTVSAVSFIALAGALALYYLTGVHVFKVLAISFGTVFYHFYVPDTTLGDTFL